MPKRKSKLIELHYGLPYRDLLKKWYQDELLSSIEIQERISRDAKIFITPRSVQRAIKLLGIMRSFSQAFLNAIQKGRKSYDSMRKPVTAKELRKGITIRVRYGILQRDNFRCVLCGSDASETRLEIDH